MAQKHIADCRALLERKDGEPAKVDTPVPATVAGTQTPTAPMRTGSVDPGAQAPAVPVASDAALPAGVDLSKAASPPPVAQDSSASPFYARWWFWTGVGAIVVAGTVTAIALSKRGSENLTAGSPLGTQPVFQ